MKRKTTVVAILSAALLLASCSSSDEVPSSSAGPDLVSAPDEVRWMTGPAGLSYPASDVSGPSTSTPVPHGWTGDPQGAVLAAMTTQVFLSGADDALWPAVSQTLIEPGPGRDQWAQARALVSVEGTLVDAPEMHGFSINDFSEDSALVTVAARWPDGMVAALPVQLSRATGDWKVVLPTQDEAPDLTALSDQHLSEFTPFSPDSEETEP